MRVYDPSPDTLLDRVKRALRGMRAPPLPANDDRLSRMLADAGLSQADVAGSGSTRPKQRRRMAAMMRHFGIDPEAADPRHWGALRDAQRICVQCPSEGRCHRWLTWGRANDAPRVFCPNAALYDEIAQDDRGAKGKDTEGI